MAFNGAFTLGKTPVNYTPSSATLRGHFDGIDAALTGGGGGGIPVTIVDAKGDLIAATAADTVDRLAVGANGTVLKANSSTSTGLEWAAEAGGSSFFVNVEDSGAIGDGATDDTSAIQTALDAAVGKCLVFPRRGPWRCAGELRIKGNGTVLGLGGAKIEYEGADGCMGINSAAFQYLKVSGLTFEYTGGATGNVERIAFATTNDLESQSFDGGAPVEIDMMILEDCHFIRSKVLLNSGGDNKIICRHNRWTTPDATVKMEPYYLMVRFGNENDQGGVIEDRGGALIHHNVLIVHPSTADPSNTDVVKITGGLTRVKFHDNHVENLTPSTTSAQVDWYTGGGQCNCHHNDFIDVSMHFKQYGPTPGWQDHSVFSQSNFNNNFWHFKNNSQGVANACIFHRASGLTNIHGNQFKITSSNQTYAVYLDNAEVVEDSGFGTNAPYAINMCNNSGWFENNNTHRLLNSDNASFGDTEYMNFHGNMVLCPSTQSTTVANAGGRDLMSIVGNTMINGVSIQAGPGFEEAANIGVPVV